MTAKHNSLARASLIKQACRDIAPLEAARASIGAQIREIKQKIVKGDLGMRIGDFNSVLRLYGLEDEARDQFFDTLRETFSALGVGEQLSFLTPETAPEAPAPRRGRKAKPTPEEEQAEAQAAARAAHEQRVDIPEGIREGETDDQFLARIHAANPPEAAPTDDWPA